MINFHRFTQILEETDLEEHPGLLQMARKFAAMFKGSSNTDFKPIQGSVSFQAKNILGGASVVFFTEGHNEAEADAMHFTKELANGAYVNGNFAAARDWARRMQMSGYDVSKCKFRMGMNMRELEEHLNKYLI